MRSFKDSLDRDWIVTVNYTAKVRVQAACNVDLFELGVFEKLGNDPGLIIEVLTALVADQLTARSITPAQFQDGLIGDAIERASDAMIQEIIDFFPKRRREVLRKVYAAAEQVQDKAAELIEEKLNSGDLLKSLEQSLNQPFGDAPGSAVFIPVTSPSDNST